MLPCLQHIWKVLHQGGWGCSGSAGSGWGVFLPLLVPGTTVDPRTNFGIAWIPAFEALGYPYCYVVTPHRGMDDIQVSSEHVVYAIREVYRRSGRKVDIIGHSQGGTNPRWALRWWPDTRAMVGDYIGIAPSAHGG